MQQQKTHSTEYNRYPDIFRICKEYFGESVPDILSFGCSTGEEWLYDYAFLMPNGIIPDKLVYTAGTQFVVSKELILNHSLEYYKFLLAWLYYTDMPDSQSGRLFEYTWHYILTGDGVEKQYKNRFI